MGSGKPSLSRAPSSSTPAFISPSSSLGQRVGYEVWSPLLPQKDWAKDRCNWKGFPSGGGGATVPGWPTSCSVPQEFGMAIQVMTSGCPMAPPFPAIAARTHFFTTE